MSKKVINPLIESVGTPLTQLLPIRIPLKLNKSKTLSPNLKTSLITIKSSSIQIKSKSSESKS